MSEHLVDAIGRLRKTNDNLIIALVVIIGLGAIIGILLLLHMFTLGVQEGHKQMQNEAIKLGLGEWNIVDKTKPDAKFIWILREPVNPSTTETMNVEPITSW